ncbi:MAG: alanine--tRNA ligase [Parachlamydiales bacterium]|nr:alanine--tRNA ligase [Parachlamydiales bacterium]
MTSQDIRRKFLHYFASQGHTLVPSSPVVPHDDPTLLFINAGMNQFKDVFLGTSRRDYTRATTTQKCIRVGGKHNDLDNVGHTSRHLTFFEMLGNFSFGDYFKKEAIGFAWDVTTHIFDFDPDKIWASVFENDDEAFELWQKHLPSKRIIRLGEKDNFWAMGETGPCGPCSELLYDRGAGYGKASTPREDLSGERFLEFWNLVFMQFSKDLSGTMTPLPKPCIDTGAGLERIMLLKIGSDSVFDTDILRSIIAKIENLSKIRYDKDHVTLAPAFHVIADHLRSLSFAISDGAQPSNVDRGYILRKLLRRAVRYGKMLQFQKPFLAKVLPRLIESMGDDFPELVSAENRIAEILTMEEESFLKTLQRGGNLLTQIIDRSQKIISGEDAFKLKDTYGLPIEEILLIAKDAHLTVDLETFEQLEKKAKVLSQKAHKKEQQLFQENLFVDFAKTHSTTEFVGYDSYKAEAKILAIVLDDHFVDSLSEGQEGLIITDRTPFYAEMGGQIGDSGTIYKKANIFEVERCITPYAGISAHQGIMHSGLIKKGDSVTLEIDHEKREKISNNHSATHLLHWALEKVLGSHIRQAGSYVDDQRLRFDFTHHKALTEEELRAVEQEINARIRENSPVQNYSLPYETVQKDPKIKQFFGEKYRTLVRVVDIEYSKELCGGTHARSLGSIGLCKILKEGSIAAGVRRIEAVTGKAAEDLIYAKEDLLCHASALLKTTQDKLLGAIESLLEEKKQQQNDLKKYRCLQIQSLIDTLKEKKEKVGDITLIVKQIDLTPEDLNALADELIRLIPSSVIVLGTKIQNRCHLVSRVTPDLADKGISAKKIITEIAPIVQGGGGGKETRAQAGGSDVSKLPDALKKVKQLLQKLC